ncbi:hypothetical protein EVAR_60472_1 [Eumeta japonica]|uniref:Uncharacterized protein n=1 Tax=Eumeta variegata TaxID=151549 RepID=A0A4C1ZIW4_EUMVA|nr:hypothetical protein EVAR_60472_1 [Eumeta japonica]
MRRSRFNLDRPELRALDVKTRRRSRTGAGDVGRRHIKLVLYAKGKLFTGRPSPFCRDEILIRPSPNRPNAAGACGARADGPVRAGGSKYPMLRSCLLGEYKLKAGRGGGSVIKSEERGLPTREHRVRFLPRANRSEFLKYDKLKIGERVKSFVLNHAVASATTRRQRQVPTPVHSPRGAEVQNSIRLKVKDCRTLRLGIGVVNNNIN